MERIAYCLKKRRKELGYTKSYVAERAGITQNSMVNIEHGKLCSVRSLLAICEVLKLRIDIVDNNLSNTICNIEYKFVK